MPFGRRIICSSFSATGTESSDAHTEMIANHDRAKLVNAIVYFGQHTKKCGMTKLFKLLYFLDFEHYKKTGRSVTGLRYFAWPMGPVPVSLKEELSQPEADLSEKIIIREVPTRFEQPLRLIEAKGSFDPAHFSKREIRLLKELANEYKDSTADEMIEATHLETLPWHRVFEDEKRRQAEIPYEYVLRPDETEMMRHVSTGNREISENYR